MRRRWIQSHRRMLSSRDSGIMKKGSWPGGGRNHVPKATEQMKVSEGKLEGWPALLGPVSAPSPGSIHFCRPHSVSSVCYSCICVALSVCVSTRPSAKAQLGF